MQATKSDKAGVLRLPTALIIFGVSLVVMTVLSLIGPCITYLRHANSNIFAVLWPPYPGYDFYAYLVRMQSLRKPDFFALPGYPRYYPAGGALAYGFFYVFCPGGQWKVGYLIFAAMILAGTLFSAYRLSRALRTEGLRTNTAENLAYGTLLVSWPIYLSLQRGNLESVLWLLLAAAIWLLAKEQWTLPLSCWAPRQP